MGCVVAIVAVLMPRTVMLFIWLLTDWFSRAFETALWPILGWFFMPYTTLAYMAAVLNGGFNVWWLAVFLFAILVDLFGSAVSAKNSSD